MSCRTGELLWWGNKAAATLEADANVDGVNPGEAVVVVVVPPDVLETICEISQ